MTVAGWVGLGALVFVAAAVYDLAYARYVQAAAAERAARAAAWSAITAAVGLVSLLGVLRASPWLAVPEIAGLYVGTYVGIAWKQPRFRRASQKSP